MTRIEYMNDTNTGAIVYCGSDMAGEPTFLRPATSALFYLDIPMRQCLFIKVWQTNVVFITHRMPVIDNQANGTSTDGRYGK